MPVSKKKTSPKKPTTSKTTKLTKLIIVESPSKATTLKKYLGSTYTVKASAGHLIDLPKSTLGIDTETFEPHYIVMRDRSTVMKDLVNAAKNASEIFLASDPDREGEAIASHLKNYFEEKVLPKLKRIVPISRIRFSEITKDAIIKAVSEPSEITTSLVNAQQGRRVIDRLFGYGLSPLLWKKVKGKLSAGRVQSTVLRLIVDREKEIQKFVTQEYWECEANFSYQKNNFMASLNKIGDKRVVSPAEFEKDSLHHVIKSKKEIDMILAELSKSKFVVKDYKVSSSFTKASAPFITSTLQQTANSLLGWPTAKTMRTAQELYEGIDLGKTRTGLITYMRTDSTRISPVAFKELESYIKDNFGKEYLPDSPNFFSNKKNSQDAHEAIRPTSTLLYPDHIKEHLSADQYKLYNLIWRRFVASQMTRVEREVQSLSLQAGAYLFGTSGSRVVFEGFQRVWNFSVDKKADKNPPVLEVGIVVPCKSVDPEQKFTQPPARYSEASLVKTMEELGIGRPSTYAPTIMTLTKRYYVKKNAKSLVPTELGMAVNKLLTENFDTLINAKFTAQMEENLDAVEEQELLWKEVVKEFYLPFNKKIEDAFEKIDSIKGAFDETTDYVCEKCGRPMLKKLGKYGYFLACSGWPECSNAQPIPFGTCPKCGEGSVVEKRGGRRGSFYSCTRYPECDFITNSKPSGKICPNDKSPLFFEAGFKNIVKCLKESCSHTEEYSEN
ncbi:MAG: type I DNA topoisomerase [Brevinema sp.]